MPGRQKAITYLVLELDRGSLYRAPRVVNHRKTKPSLEAGQIAVKVVLDIPMDVFDTFIPVVTAELSEAQISTPEITIESADS
jgi:hypothetical protein